MAALEASYNESSNHSKDYVDDQKWQKMFPRCLAGCSQSVAFMTRAIYVAFSMILERRGILRKDFFTKNYITDKLKCSVLSFHNPNSLHIAQLFKNMKGAIEKGYLKEISLVIAENEDDEEAIEVYAFKFHYYPDGNVKAEFKAKGDDQKATPFDKLGALEYDGSESVRNQLVLLARCIIYLCQKLLSPLPPKYAANFRCHYTDEAPNGYKIDGFSHADALYTTNGDIQTAIVGHLRPGYHGVLMECSSMFMEDAYVAEMRLKRHAEKIADAFGYDANDTFYSTMETDNNNENNNQQAPPPLSDSQKAMEELSSKLGASVHVKSPMIARPMTRRRAAAKAAVKAAPYKKNK